MEPPIKIHVRVNLPPCTITLQISVKYETRVIYALYEYIYIYMHQFVHCTKPIKSLKAVETFPLIRLIMLLTDEIHWNTVTFPVNYDSDAMEYFVRKWFGYDKLITYNLVNLICRRPVFGWIMNPYPDTKGSHWKHNCTLNIYLIQFSINALSYIQDMCLEIW